MYTVQDHIDRRTNCINDRYGQLHNENLFGHLWEGKFRETICARSPSYPQVIECHAKYQVQDFTPRNFAFSFGFTCKEPGTISSLKGLQYNVSVYNQANRTQCEPLPPEADAMECFRSHEYMTFPSLGGDLSWDVVLDRADYFQNLRTLTVLLMSTEYNGSCYQHLSDVICKGIIPICDPIRNVSVPICREMCYGLKDSCVQKLLPIIAKQKTLPGPLTTYWVEDLKETNLAPKMLDCEYLPSVNDDTIPCFYKPVVCEEPPVVQNTKMLGLKDAYNELSSIQYVCDDAALEIKGNANITCLYSGQWTTPPQCLRQSESVLKIVLPVLLTSLLLYILLVFCGWYCRKKTQNLTRNRQYDAFVCYCYEGQDPDFAEKVVPLELEEKHDFKLCIHRRDFKAGWDIKWNIMNAIRNSNSAIIIMSQDYINSLWCAEEFEDCYMENMKDPTFKLFVILIQPADTLNMKNEYIKSFFTKKTYLEKEDPKLFKKIAEYLTWVKQPKREKSPLDGAIDDTHDPLLKQHEAEEGEGIGVEELKDTIKLRKLNNPIEVDVDSEDSEGSDSDDDDDDDDDDLHDTGDQLSEGISFTGNFSQFEPHFKNIEVSAEVHRLDAASPHKVHSVDAD